MTFILEVVSKECKRGEKMTKEIEIERMMDTYGNYIVRMCYMMLKNRTLAEDAAQEVFIKAYKNMESFRKDASEKTWLTSIALNVCKNYARTSWFRRVQIGIEVKADTYSMEDRLTEEIEKSELLKKVMDLSKKYREVILLYYYQDLKISEIAEILEVSESSVKMRLNRAKLKLKDELKEEYIYG